MKASTILFLLTTILLSTCVHESTSSKVNVPLEESGSPKDLILNKEIPFLDTTVLLHNLKPSTYHGAPLTADLAKEILYQHYVKKGFFSSDELPEIINPSEDNKLAIYFDTIYPLHLNNNEKRLKESAYLRMEFWMRS